MRVTALNVHPLKSTAIRPVLGMEITPWGPRGDREWMVVDAEGTLVSARETRALFTVQADTPATDPTLARPLRLAAPGHPSIELDHPTDNPEPVRLFSHDLLGVPVGPVADDWLRRVLNRDDVRLLWCDDPMRRRTQTRGLDIHSQFPDGYPVTVATEASLAQLNRWVAQVARERGEAPETIPMARFRPNLVLDGDEPFTEDDWTTLRIGPVELRMVKPVARCVMTTIDPATLTSAKEPLRTLARFRRPERKTLFCVHAAVVTPGVVRLGDSADVTA